METWPALDYAQWKDTAAGLQLRLQIAGKVRLKKSPWLNHSWHATFYVSARGLTSSPIPDGERQFVLQAVGIAPGRFVVISQFFEQFTNRNQLHAKLHCLAQRVVQHLGYMV